MKLRYDLLGAGMNGENRHPEEVLKELKISYQRFEGVPVADCIYLHNAQLTGDQLPPWITVCKHNQ